MITTNESPLTIVPNKNKHYTHSIYFNDKLFSKEVVFDKGLYYSEQSHLDYNLISPLPIKHLLDDTYLGYFDLPVYKELQLHLIRKENSIFTLEMCITVYEFKNSIFNYNRFIKLLIKKIIPTDLLRRKIYGNPKVDEGECLSLQLYFSPECTETSTVQEAVAQLKAIVKPYYDEATRELLKEGEVGLREE